MRKWLLLLLVLLPFLIAGTTGQQFMRLLKSRGGCGGVSDCVAEWSFESGALGTDNHPVNSNDLTTQEGTPSADGTNYKEQSYSLYVNGAESLERSDANLSSDFPGKNGTGNDTFSIAFWFRHTSGDVVAYDAMVTKHDTNLSSYGVYLYDQGSEDVRFALIIGYNNGDSFTKVQHASDLAGSTWYFGCATYNNTSTDTNTFPYQLMVRNTSCSVVGSDVSADITLDSGGINIETADFAVGAGGGGGDDFTGNIDRLMVFGNDKILTTTECTNLCNATSVCYD
jgi:hypothetical protein